VPEGLKAPTKPRPETEAEAETSVEAPKAKAAIGATVTPGVAAGARPAALGSQEAPSS